MWDWSSVDASHAQQGVVWSFEFWVSGSQQYVGGMPGPSCGCPRMWYFEILWLALTRFTSHNLQYAGNSVTHLLVCSTSPALSRITLPFFFSFFIGFYGNRNSIGRNLWEFLICRLFGWSGAGQCKNLRLGKSLRIAHRHWNHQTSA